MGDMPTPCHILKRLWRTGRNGDTSALLQSAGLLVRWLEIPRHGVGTCLLTRQGGGVLPNLPYQMTMPAVYTSLTGPMGLT